jgi:RNA polymerase sigma-70 factor, ECF subfamily
MSYAGADTQEWPKGERVLTEEQIMELIASGDQSAYAEAVRRHGRSIAAFAYRMTGQQADAEDIAQETFLKLWTHAHRWQADKAAVSTWLHRIAHNLCIDLLRRDKSAINMALEDEHADPALSSEQLISLDADRVSLQQVISSLPERQRSALIMTHYQGLPDKVVAGIMDVSVDALESLLARARKTIKVRLLHDKLKNSG